MCSRQQYTIPTVLLSCVVFLSTPEIKTPTFLPRTSMCIANSKDTNHAHILPHYSPVSFPHASFVGVSKGLVCRPTSSTTSLSTGWLWSNVLKARYGCSLRSPRTGHRMYPWHLQQQNTQNTLRNDTIKFLDLSLIHI